MLSDEFYLANLRKLKSRLKVPLLVTYRPNYIYLTGFAGSSGYLLLAQDDVLIVDGRYMLEAQQTAHGVQLEFLDWQGEMLSQLANIVKRRGVRTLYLEPEVRFSSYRRLSEAFKREGIKLEVLEENPVTSMRAVKQPQEIELIKRSLKRAEEILEATARDIREGVRESELAGKIYYLALSSGYSYSFDPIVAFGNRTAMPHYKPSTYSFNLSEPILIDMGLRYKWYCSDITRSYMLTPNEEYRKVFTAVKDAQLSAIEKVKPGVPVRELDSTAREVLRNYGLDKYFIHALGHGVGLEIHEYPRISVTSEAILQVGMVITIEPGVYIPGKFGIRLEQMVLVNDDGPELLNELPQEPVP